MVGVGRRKLGDMPLDCGDDGLAKLFDDRIDAAEQGSIGLRAASNRLIEIFALGVVKPAQGFRQLVEGRQEIRDVCNADQARLSFQPLPARIASHAPGGAGVGPKFAGLIPGQLPLDLGQRRLHSSNPKEVAESPFAQCRIDMSWHIAE